MSTPSVRRALAVAIAAVALFGLSPSPAHAYTQGPKNWGRGETTSRYPRHAGNHYTGMTECGRQTHRMELRVDIVNKSDWGYGMKKYTCGVTILTQLSNYDSYGSSYRGHFLQVEYGFYGTLRDNG